MHRANVIRPSESAGVHPADQAKVAKQDNPPWASKRKMTNRLRYRDASGRVYSTSGGYVRTFNNNNEFREYEIMKRIRGGAILLINTHRGVRRLVRYTHSSYFDDINHMSDG